MINLCIIFSALYKLSTRWPSSWSLGREWKWRESPWFSSQRIYGTSYKHCQYHGKTSSNFILPSHYWPKILWEIFFLTYYTFCSIYRITTAKLFYYLWALLTVKKVFLCQNGSKSTSVPNGTKRFKIEQNIWTRKFFKVGNKMFQLQKNAPNFRFSLE